MPKYIAIDFYSETRGEIICCSNDLDCCKELVFDLIEKTDGKCKPKIFKKLEDVPAADVEPVLHGYWVKGTGLFHYRICSQCARPSNNLCDDPYSYCPHCGAKMDAKDGEEKCPKST